MVVAMPLGLGAAIYLTEYARPARAQDRQADPRAAGRRPDDRLRLLRAHLLHARDPARLVGIDVGIFNALTAGIIIGFLVIPTIASISEDAMSAVPQSLREGAFGLGAAQAAGHHAGRLPGRAVGHRRRVVLGVSRAVGETMVVLIAAGPGGHLASTRPSR